MSFAHFFLLDYWSYLLRELSKSRKLVLCGMNCRCYPWVVICLLIFVIIFVFYPVEIFLLVTGVCLS